MHLKFLKRPVFIVLVVWFAFSWSWTLSTDSLDLAGNKLQGLVLAVIISAINIAISVTIIWLCIKYVQKVFLRYSWWASLLLAWLLFAFADFLISWLPAFLWIGPQGSIDNILPLSSPTLLLINTPFGFSSRLIGFYGLAGLFWLLAFLLWSKSKRKLILWPIVVLVSTTFIGWLLWHTPTGPATQATIISESLDQRLPAIEPKNTALVIFPEYGLDKIDNKNLKERINRSNNPNETKVFFLGSAQVFPEGNRGHYNVLTSGNNYDGINQTQNKYRLIPGGEDLAYILRLGLRATNMKSTLDYFSYAKSVIKGEHSLQPLQVNETTKLGSAVCSSIISPRDYRIFAKQGATLFTNSASLTIFKGSPVFAWQQKSLAKFMAISNSRYFLQSANSARAYALDNNGKTLDQFTGHAAKTITVENNTDKTIYTFSGEILAAIGGLLTVLFFVQYLLHKRSETTTILAAKPKIASKSAKRKKKRNT